MRDFALHQAMSMEQIGAPWFVRLWRNIKARRAVSRLDRFDDVMLADIGLSRADLEWARRLPLSVNATLALQQQNLYRRSEDRLTPSSASHHR